VTVSLPERHTNEDGSRFYTRVDPATGEEHQYWSVTTALSAKHKEGLKWWSAKIAARRAMDNLPKMLRAQRIDSCGRTWARSEPVRCDECPDCVQRWIELFHVGESERRKHEGSAVHDAVEHWIQHGVWLNAATLAQPYIERHPTIADMLPPYLERCQEWIDDYGLRRDMFFASEMTVYNHTHRYAGTCDGGIWLEPVNAKAAKLVARIRGDLKDERTLVIFDAKSREGEDKVLYDDHPLQLVAYRRAETCKPSRQSLQEFPMPSTAGAVVFQPRPDGYAFEPVVTEEPEFRTFLNYLQAYRWQVERGPASIQVKSFPVPAGFEWPPKAAPAEPATGAASVAGETPAPAPAPAKKATRARKAATPKKSTATTRTVAEAAPRIAGATVDSLTRGGRPPHPDSPYGDEIPF
jgi:hypothetical protein